MNLSKNGDDDGSRFGFPGLIGLVAEVLAVANGVPPTGLVAIAGTALGAKATRAFIGEHRRRVSVALDAAERISGKSREELDDLIEGVPEAVPILIRLLTAIGEAGDDTILRTLGAGYGKVLLNPSAAHEQEVLAMAIRGVGSEHIRILKLMPENKEYRLSPEVAEEAKTNGDLILILLRGLAANGLLSEGGGYVSASGFAITDLGLTVLEALAEVSEAADR